MNLCDVCHQPVMFEQGSTVSTCRHAILLDDPEPESETLMLANQLGIAHLRIQALEARLGQLLMALKDYKKHGEWCLVERAAIAATEPR